MSKEIPMPENIMDINEPLKDQITMISAADIPADQKDEFLDQVVEVEQSAWPPELQAPREKFEKRFDLFPQGFFVAKKDGKIVGVTTAEITNYEAGVHKTWDEITDSGRIEGTHNPNGEGLYVVSVGVSPDAQGGGIGGKLVQAQKELTARLGLKYLYLGARMPGYDEYCSQNGDIDAQEYLRLGGGKPGKEETYDPEIRFYQRQGLQPVKVVPNFEPDVQSRDFGVVMMWQNPAVSPSK